MNHHYHSLDEALASLAPGHDPARDLWPGIAAALAPRASPAPRAGATPVTNAASTRRPFALAAGLAMLGLAGSLAFNLRSLPLAPGGSASSAGSAQPLPGSQAIAAHFSPPDDAAYRNARAELERTFNERLALLAPATRSRVQADLATIRAANADIRAALAQDPASPLLLQLLNSTSQQEIDLYTNVARATAPMISRSTRT
jgi:hypothetical protein